MLWGLAAAYARLRHREGLGFGDVKMIAGIGAAVGPVALPAVTLVAAVLALAAAGLRREGAATAQPFGAALAAGSALVLLAERLTL